MQGGVTDGGTVDLHGLQDGTRRDDARASDVPLDGHQAGDLLDGGQLVGDGPAGSAGAGARLALVGRQVGLDHDPVDAERQRGAQGTYGVHPRLDLLDRGGQDRRHVRARRRVHAEAGDVRQDLAVGQLGEGLTELPGIGQRQRAVGEEGRLHPVGAVLGAQSARRPVARVGEGGAAVFRADRVALLELVVRHEDLAAHLDGDRLGQPLRQSDDGSRRVRDVLARRAVAPGDEALEPAVAIARGDRQAVELRLDAPRGHRSADAPLQRGGPGRELLGREHIVQGEHGNRVRHIADRDPARDLARRRGGEHLLRVVRLVRGYAARQPVVGVVVQPALARGVVRGGGDGGLFHRGGIGGGIGEHSS